MPSVSISVKIFHAASSSCLVSDSTYHEPPAGSLTRPTFDS